jgi:hypothetical protein
LEFSDAPVPLKSGAEIILPDDLEAYLGTWGDEWARKDERAHIRSLFAEFNAGDDATTWQRVRRAVSIGELP